MYLKVHESAQGKIVAACDRELVGRVLVCGKMRLDLKAYAGFYKGEAADGGLVLKALCGATSANLVGEKSVEVAIGARLASKEDIIYFGSVPHLQIYKL
ncbi:DUF424 family protein [Candidatus Parvarchaeota archaeon]|nr:DUF424 family protein [Candidatus Parvarchaeota archaeon]